MARAHDQAAPYNEAAANGEKNSGMPGVMIGAGSPEAAQQLRARLPMDHSGFATHAATDQLDFARTILSGGQRTGVVVLLVDADAGSADDMLWRCYLSGLLGIDHIVLVIDNLEDSGPARFERLVDQYRNTLADGAGSKLTAVPVSIRTGANIAGAGGPEWYQGEHLTVVLSDIISNQSNKIPRKASAEFANEADQFAAHLIWFDNDAMLPERPYEIRMASGTATAQVTQLRHRVDVVTLEQMAATTLNRGEIGHCNFAIDAELAFDTFAEHRSNGSFALHDKHTNALVGMGVIEFALRRASNLSWHDMKVSKQARALNNQQKPCVLWFTGLSGAGKSTVADLLEVKLHDMGRRTYLLDGDNVRHGLNKDLGFTDRDRVENIRRVAEVSKLMVDAGLIVIVSFISPFRSERQMARDLMDDGEFLEVFVDTPLEVCEERDPKGLYKKARSGELKNFTGIDSDYEPPLEADLTLTTVTQDVETIVGNVIVELQHRGCL